MPIIKTCVSAFNLLQDVGGFRGPDEGLWVLIVAVDVFVDCGDQLFDAAEDAAP